MARERGRFPAKPRRRARRGVRPSAARARAVPPERTRPALRGAGPWAPRPPPACAPGKRPRPRELLAARAPVGVQHAEALGQRQAREEGPAAAAHMRLRQVDGDPGEARGGGVGARSPGPRSAPFREHRGAAHGGGGWSQRGRGSRKGGGREPTGRRRRGAPPRGGPAPLTLGPGVSRRWGRTGRGGSGWAVPEAPPLCKRGSRLYANEKAAPLYKYRRPRLYANEKDAPLYKYGRTRLLFKLLGQTLSRPGGPACGRS